jgi:hypothetical protein
MPIPLTDERRALAVDALSAYLDYVCTVQGFESRDDAIAFVLHELSDEGIAERIDQALREQKRRTDA